MIRALAGRADRGPEPDLHVGPDLRAAGPDGSTHADLYRLADPGEVAELGLEEAGRWTALCWSSGRSAPVGLLPEERLTVALRLVPGESPRRREVEVVGPERFRGPVPMSYMQPPLSSRGLTAGPRVAARRCWSPATLDPAVKPRGGRKGAARGSPGRGRDGLTDRDADIARFLATPAGATPSAGRWAPTGRAARYERLRRAARTAILMDSAADGRVGPLSLSTAGSAPSACRRAGAARRRRARRACCCSRTWATTSSARVLARGSDEAALYRPGARRHPPLPGRAPAPTSCRRWTGQGCSACSTFTSISPPEPLDSASKARLRRRSGASCCRSPAPGRTSSSTATTTPRT